MLHPERNHDALKTVIENHLKVAQNVNVDRILRDRAVRELERFRGDYRVDEFFAVRERLADEKLFAERIAELKRRRLTKKA